MSGGHLSSEPLLAWTVCLIVLYMPRYWPHIFWPRICNDMRHMFLQLIWEWNLPRSFCSSYQHDICRTFFAAHISMIFWGIVRLLCTHAVLAFIMQYKHAIYRTLFYSWYVQQCLPDIVCNLYIHQYLLYSYVTLYIRPVTETILTRAVNLISARNRAGSARNYVNI